MVNVNVPHKNPSSCLILECASQEYCLRELFMLRGCVCYGDVVNCVYLNLTRIPHQLKGENGTARSFSTTEVL